MVTILHLADLHLDTPFKGLFETDEALAKRLRDATLAALDGAVAFALEQRALGKLDAVTFGGDVFDEASPSLRARRHFSDKLAELCRAGVPCFIVAGNHDPLDDRFLWQTHVVLPEGCTLFGAEWGVGIIEQGGTPACAILGRSYSSLLNDGSCLLGMEEHASALAGAPLRVGLLHCDAGGGKSELTGYAPVAVSDLVQTHLDAWLLGHIHKRPEQPLSDRPLITYPGNPQGRDINEAGLKGGLLVRLEPGRAPTSELVPLGPILWANVAVPVSHLAGDIAVAAAVRESLGEAVTGGSSAVDGLIARVTLTGRPDVETWRLLRDPQKLAEIRQNAAEPDGTPFLVIEELRSAARPPLPPREVLAAQEDLLGDFLRLVSQARSEPDGEAGKAVDEAWGALDRAAAAVGFERESIGLDRIALLDAAEEIALALLWDEEAAPVGDDEEHE